MKMFIREYFKKVINFNNKGFVFSILVFWLVWLIKLIFDLIFFFMILLGK